MADFGNHQRFTLRCLDYRFIPVSCRLKNSIRTPRNYDIIRRAERQLMNERVRNINSSLNMFGIKSNTCGNQLAGKTDKQLFSECLKSMVRIKQARHIKTLTRQLKKFDRLQQKHYGGLHSNYKNHIHNVSLLINKLHNNSYQKGINNINNNKRTNNNDNSNHHRGDNDKNNHHKCDNNSNTGDTNRKWFINLSNSPLTKAQRSLLARGPKFAVVTRHDPKGEYTAVLEEVCNCLPLNSLQSQEPTPASFSTKHTHRPNSTLQEARATKELKTDQSRIIHSVDKGVAMVVMDRQGYINRPQGLLDSKDTYMPISKDSSSTPNNHLILLLKNFKSKGQLAKPPKRDSTLLATSQPNCMDYPIPINKDPP